MPSLCPVHATVAMGPEMALITDNTYIMLLDRPQHFMLLASARKIEPVTLRRE